jgi:hypothetical protein
MELFITFREKSVASYVNICTWLFSQWTQYCGGRLDERFFSSWFWVRTHLTRAVLQLFLYTHTKMQVFIHLPCVHLFN